MLFYYGILLVIILTCLICIGLKQKLKNYRKTSLIIIGIILIFIMGLRDSSVGTDTANYGNVYNALGSASFFEDVGYSGMPGYSLLCKIIYFISFGNYQCMMFTTATIIIICIFRFIYIYSENAFLSVMLFILLFFYYYSWNASRQMLAFSLCLMAIDFYNKRRFKFSLAFFTFAVTVHATAIVMAIYIIALGIKWSRVKYIVFIAIMTGMFFAYTYIFKLFVYVFPRYSIYINYVTKGDKEIFGETQGRKIILSLIYLLFIVIVLFMIRSFNKEKFDIWAICALLIIDVIIGVFFRYDTLLIRIQSYFSFFAVFIMPSVFQKVKDYRIKLMLYIFTFLILLVPYTILLTSGNSNILPYKFFI